MIFLGLSAVSVGLILVGNFLYNSYVEDKYEQDVNACTYADYELYKKLPTRIKPTLTADNPKKIMIVLLPSFLLQVYYTILKIAKNTESIF